MKKILLPILLSFLFLMMIGTTNALVRDQQMLFPNSSGIITSASGILVTLQTEVNGSMYANYGNAITGVNVSNVSWTITGISGRACVNSSNVNNNTLSTWICQVEVTSIPDITLVTVQATVWNGTSASDSGFTARNTTSSTSVRIDNTVPDITFGDSAPGAGSTQSTKSITVDTIADTNASSCTLVLDTTDRMSVSPDSNEECSKALSLNAGSHTIQWIGNDGYNVTTGASRTFTVAINFAEDGEASEKGASGEQTVTAQKFSTVMLFGVGILALAGVAGLAFLIVGAVSGDSKKKGRKR